MRGVNVQVVKQQTGCTHEIRLREEGGTVTLYHYGETLMRDGILAMDPKGDATATGIAVALVRRFHGEDGAR